MVVINFMHPKMESQMEITPHDGKYWKSSLSSVDKRKTKIHEGDGEIVRYKIIGDQKYLPINYELWEFEPGASEGDHIHSGYTEIYYCLSGKGAITINGKRVRFTEGDTVLVPPEIDHGVYNTDFGKTMKLLIIWGSSTQLAQNQDD